MLEEALKRDAKLGAACESLSYLSLEQGHITEATKWASQAITLSPQSARANYYRAMTLVAGGNRDEETLSKAESSVRAALKINPEFAPAYDGLALVLSQPGPTQKLDEAYKATLEALALDPTNIRYRTRAVDILEKQGGTEDAIRVATLALKLAKTPAEQSEASAYLAGAKQFKISVEKMKKLQESQPPATSSPQNLPATAASGAPCRFSAIPKVLILALT